MSDPSQGVHDPGGSERGDDDQRREQLGAILAGLDDEQRHAVTTDSQLVAVIAGAGSGKTRVLTRRIAYRVVTGSADAGHTVVLTFTREAAGELRRRLPRLGLSDRIVAGTFHSVCHQLLRQRWSDLDRAPKTIVTDRRRIVREIAGGAQLDELVAELDYATARGLGGEGYLQAVRRGERHPGVAPDRVATVLLDYEQAKRRRGVLDLDDLLGQVIDGLERDAEFAAVVRWRFRHVLVDEAQDLNPLQHRLIDLLRFGRDDLFLVGDPSQAIYGFNGSDPSLLAEVGDRFPGVEVVRLPVNRRSTPQVVDAGAHVLGAAGQSATIRSARPDGPAVSIVRHGDEAAEAAAIAVAIARLDPGLVSAGDVAVLARTHAVLAPIRSALAEAGVDVRVRLDGSGSPFATLLAEASRLKDAERLRRWIRDLADPAPSTAEGDRSLGDHDEVRAQLAEVALDFLREQPTGDGAAFRAWIVANDPLGADGSGVDLLTFHAAKGREWHTVHLAGCETSLVPHRSATTATARAEEARLLYVAVTRATDALALHWAERRGGYQRKLTPWLDGFRSDTPEPAPPPAHLVPLARPEREVTLDRLRAWRDVTARAAGIVPSAVCSDRTLADIAARRPSDPHELDAVTGLGPMTARRLFPGIERALTADS